MMRERHIDILTSLQARILSQPPPLPATPDHLFRQLRKALQEAADEGLLATPPQEIFRLLKHARGDTPTHHVIIGGDKNFKRRKDLAHFTRSDGAWFDFAITVAHPRGKEIELIGYNFELRFDLGEPRFIRFDLNEPEHNNQARGIRSHLHPSSDDLSVPSPLMSPLEVLHIFLHELWPPDKRRAAG